MNDVYRVCVYMLVSGISIFWNWSTSKFVAACEYYGLQLETVAYMHLLVL